MGDLGVQMVEFYRERKNTTIKLLNNLIMFTSVMTGLMEIFKLHIFIYEKMSFHTPLFVDTHLGDYSISFLLIGLGLLVPILFVKGKIKLYKLTLFCLLLVWSFLFFFFIFVLFLGNLNFSWILVFNVIVLILHVMKK